MAGCAFAALIAAKSAGTRTACLTRTTRIPQLGLHYMPSEMSGEGRRHWPSPRSPQGCVTPCGDMVCAPEAVASGQTLHGHLMSFLLLSAPGWGHKRAFL